MRTCKVKPSNEVGQKGAYENLLHEKMQAWALPIELNSRRKTL